MKLLKTLSVVLRFDACMHIDLLEQVITSFCSLHKRISA